MSKYYQLLEMGDKLQRGDCFFVRYDLAQPAEAGFVGDSNHNAPPYLRPVTVDEWHDYAKVKPTKEDFEPTGYCEFLFDDGSSSSYGKNTDFQNVAPIHWRRITPPEQPKPESVTVKIGCREIKFWADGSARVDDGTEIHKEMLDAFIAARAKVMGKV